MRISDWSSDVCSSDLVAFGREPVRPLPAIDAAEHGAQRLHAVVAGRPLQGTGGSALLVRVVDGEDVGIGLLGLMFEVAPRGVAAEAARADAPSVNPALAPEHPVGELHTGAPPPHYYTTA